MSSSEVGAAVGTKLGTAVGTRVGLAVGILVGFLVWVGYEEMEGGLTGVGARDAAVGDEEGAEEDGLEVG